jgi:hypothetical protein
MTPRKTIYISEKDEPTWKRAEELAGTSLSALLAQLLRDYVAGMERAQPRLKELTERLERQGLSPADLRKLRRDPELLNALRSVIAKHSDAVAEEVFGKTKPKAARSRRKG